TGFDASPYSAANSARVRNIRSLRSLDQLDLVSVGVFDESDDRRAALDRPGLPRHLSAGSPDAFANTANVVDADCDMSEACAELVVAHAIVVRQLDHRML